MEQLFQRLVAAFHLPSVPNDVLKQLTVILQEQTDESIGRFISEKYQWLDQLEHKIWHILIWNSTEWFYQPNSLEFFQTLAAFNKRIIFNQDQIKEEVKISLLIPQTTDQFDQLFQNIQQTIDENEPLIHISNLWFNNLAYLLHEYPRLVNLPLIIQINDYLGNYLILSEQFKIYLIELQQTLKNFTQKNLFYLQTIPLYLNTYFYSNPSSSNYTQERVLQHIGEDFLQMVQIQSTKIELWNKDVLSCVTHLIGFFRSFLWWDSENGMKLKLLFTTEKSACDYTQALFRFVSHQSFYKSLITQWSNDETILFDSTLLFLINIVQTQNINWFFQSITQLPAILLTLTELDVYFRLYLCIYALLGEILTDENLKELKMTDKMRTFLFHMLEEAWRHPSKRYKQIPIIYFLRGCLNLSKNDFLQQATAKLNKIFLFIEMCDEYPLVYDIIWSLSFNHEVQQQLRTCSIFMSKLAQLAKESDDEHIRKSVQGILWNLDGNHDDRQLAKNNDRKNFDIMISYSHKNSELCKKIYGELVKAGYRVWIDFDQMHGNIMDAMAYAIEQSETVIICLSEDYRKSNYCRAEAHYAFQRQRKIVPVLLQKHYKPDGWLLFLIGQLLYVDFSKYEFGSAMKMLCIELKSQTSYESSIEPVSPKDDVKGVIPSMPTTTPPISIVLPSTTVPSMTVARSKTSFQGVLEWTQADVKEWLLKHNLVHMSHLLSHCDGRSLIYLNKYMKNCQPQQILNLLQDDALRRTKQNISLIELSCFHALMDQLKHSSQTTETKLTTEKKDF